MKLQLIEEHNLNKINKDANDLLNEIKTEVTSSLSKLERYIELNPTTNKKLSSNYTQIIGDLLCKSLNFINDEKRLMDYTNLSLKLSEEERCILAKQEKNESGTSNGVFKIINNEWKIIPAKN